MTDYPLQAMIDALPDQTRHEVMEEVAKLGEPATELSALDGARARVHDNPSPYLVVLGAWTLLPFGENVEVRD